MWNWNKKQEKSRNAEEYLFEKSSIITGAEKDILAAYLAKPEVQILVAFLKEELLTESYLASLPTKELAEVYALTRVAKDDAVKKVIAFIQNYPKTRYLEVAKEQQKTDDQSSTGTYPEAPFNF